MASEVRSHPNSIVRYRGIAGLSIDELSKISRIDCWTLRALEIGRTKIHAGHVAALTNALHVTEEALLKPCRSTRNPQISRRRAMRNLAAGRGGNKWAGKLPIPDKALPLVRELYEMMNRQKLMIKDVAEGSGVSPATVSDWRYTRSPSLQTFEAVLNNAGYKLQIVPLDDDE